jgi:hypothetical protein
MRPLNRILEAAKMRNEPVWALSESNETWVLFWEWVLPQNIEGNMRAKASACTWQPGAAAGCAENSDRSSYSYCRIFTSYRSS